MSIANLSRWSKKSYYQSSDSHSSLNSFAVSESVSEESVNADDFGTLIIIVVKAKNLHNNRAISKQNPYCSVRISKHSDRTKALTRGGQSPVWDHETRFKLNSEDDNRHLKLCVFDQNGSNTEIIGDAMIPLNPAYQATVSEGYDSWFPIHFNKRYVGEVYLEMTFYPKKGSRSSRRSSSASRTSTVSSLSNVSYLSTASYLQSNRMKHSENMPILPHDIAESPMANLPTSPSTSALSASRGRSSRPLPQIPSDIHQPLMRRMNHSRLHSLSDIPTGRGSSQEDISRLINNGYEESLFERLKPASQPFF